MSMVLSVVETAAELLTRLDFAIAIKPELLH